MSNAMLGLPEFDAEEVNSSRYCFAMCKIWKKLFFKVRTQPVSYAPSFHSLVARYSKLDINWMVFAFVRGYTMSMCFVLVLHNSNDISLHIRYQGCYFPTKIFISQMEVAKPRAIDANLADSLNGTDLKTSRWQNQSEKHARYFCVDPTCCTRCGPCTFDEAGVQFVLRSGCTSLLHERSGVRNIRIQMDTLLLLHNKHRGSSSLYKSKREDAFKNTVNIQFVFTHLEQTPPSPSPSPSKSYWR